MLEVEGVVGGHDLAALDVQTREKPLVAVGHLLRPHDAVQQLIHAVRGKHQLDVVDAAMGVDVAKALVQKLLAHAHVSLQADHCGFAEPDLAIQVVDRHLGLRDQRALRGDLVLQARDHRVERVDLSDGVVDLPLDAVELVLVVDLLPDACVVSDTRLVHGRRISPVAVDGGRVLHRSRRPRKRGQQGGKQQARSQCGQILTYRRTPM